MIKNLSLATQSVLNTIGSAVLLGFQWLISVCIVRSNGYVDAGVFSLAMTVANVFSTVANYGLRNYQLADNRRTSHQGQYLTMRLASSAFVMGAAVLYTSFQKSYTEQEKYAIILYLLYNITIVISDSLMGSIQLKRHLEINGISNIVRGFLSFVMFVSVLFATKHLITALGAMAMGSFLVLAFYDMPCYRSICKDEPETAYYRFLGSMRLYIEGFPVMFSAVIPMMVTAYPRTIIQQCLGSEQLGYFSSVYTPAVILSTVIPPALIALLPAISRHWEQNEHEALIRNIFIGYMIVVITTGVTFAVAYLWGGLFLELIFGVTIQPYVRLLSYAIATVGIGCFCTCGNNYIVGIGGNSVLAPFSCFALVVTLCLSERMIMLHGIRGALLVQVFAYAIQASLQIGYLCLKIGRKISSISD